ncbi:hypothetical protein Tco_1173141 [Tanacetum coccineum]
MKNDNKVRDKANKHIVPKKPELNDYMYNWVIAKYGKPNSWTDSQFESIADDIYTTFFEKAEPEKAEPKKVEAEMAEPKTAEHEKPDVPECSEKANVQECSNIKEKEDQQFTRHHILSQQTSTTLDVSNPRMLQHRPDPPVPLGFQAGAIATVSPIMLLLGWIPLVTVGDPSIMALLRAHLKGTYLGMNLLVVGMDANNQIIPLATGVAQDEPLVDELSRWAAAKVSKRNRKGTNWIVHGPNILVHNDCPSEVLMIIYIQLLMAPSGSDALYFDVHHDGVFVLNPLRYEHGLVYDWKLYKNRKMDYKTMCEFLKEKTDHAGFTALYFCLPECDLEVGLKIIERDSDVAAMYDFADSYGKLNMFMSHIHQNLAEFYFQNLNMEESGDEATSRLRIHEIMVKDASNMSYDELVSWAEDEAEMQTPKKKVVTPKKKVVEHVVDDVDIPLMNLVESPKLKRKLLVRNSPSPIAKRKLMGKVTSPTSYVVNKGKSVLNEGNTVNKTVEKGKSTMVEEANTVKKAVDKGKSRNMRRNNDIVIEDNVNLTVESDTDSESDPGNGINYSLYSDSVSDSEYSDKSVDYLSEGEDELTQLRKRKTEAKNAPKVRKQQTQAANEGTSSRVRQRKQHFVGDNETVIEHGGFMDDLLRKLSQDNGNDMTDPFHIVETKVEKYPIHDVDTHWRKRKPKVGDLFVDIEQLKGCLTYYALAT